MKRFFLTILLASLCHFGLVAGEPIETVPSSVEELRTGIQPIIDEQNVPGAAVALSNQLGQPGYWQVYPYWYLKAWLWLDSQTNLSCLVNQPWFPSA